MSLKEIWTDKVNGQDVVDAEDINAIAGAVIELEENGGGNVDIEEIESAINDALTEAKESGDFDGKDGVDGEDGSVWYSIGQIVENESISTYFPDAKNGDYCLNTHEWDVYHAENGKWVKIGNIKGANGVGIKSVVQTTTSDADGDSNVITVTMTDNSTSTFTVKNGSKGSKGDKGDTPIKGVDYFTPDDIEELSDMLTATEEVPSPNLVVINEVVSYPDGISETNPISGLYAWIDSDGYINIKGTVTGVTNTTLFLAFDGGYLDFPAGTYYIGFDDVLKTGTQYAIIRWNNEETYCSTGDTTPQAVVTTTENISSNRVDIMFENGATIDFKGHCWITKDKPIDFYVPKGGSYKVPIVPAKKEDIEKLDNNNILGIFDSIGGVGDSLTSGYINPTSDVVGNDTTCYSKSWLSQIKKIVGVDITHYSYQGATSKNWLQNQNGFYDKIIETPHEAYFLALGTNDASDWSGYGLGTIADMGTDTASFYGYYSKVIARIREANPKAPIFMLSHYWAGFDDYDNAIKAMSEATENAYYVDISDMDEQYPQYRQGYHFNAIGYYYIAQNIIKRVSEVIVANHPNFANLGVAGTGTDNDTDSGGGTTTPSYTNVLDTVGYTADKRLGSDGTERDNTGTYLTGFIPCECDDYLYLKNITMQPKSSADYGCYIGFYDSNKAKVHTASLTTGDSALYTLDNNGNISRILVDPYREGTAFMRIVASAIDDTSIITINEPIE